MDPSCCNQLQSSPPICTPPKTSNLSKTDPSTGYCVTEQLQACKSLKYQAKSLVEFARKVSKIIGFCAKLQKRQLDCFDLEWLYNGWNRIIIYKASWQIKLSLFIWMIFWAFVFFCLLKTHKAVQQIEHCSFLVLAAGLSTRSIFYFIFFSARLPYLRNVVYTRSQTIIERYWMIFITQLSMTLTVNYFHSGKPLH